jgi:carboxyl-terminal processing protease
MIPIGLKERTEVFENTRKTVAKKIFAPGFDPAAWAALCEAQRERILVADTVEQFEARVRDLLAHLKISHVTFFHQSLLKIPPQYAIGATFQREQVNGTSHWMFQDVHEGSPPHMVGIQPGDLLLEVEGQPVDPPEQPTFRMGGFCEVGVEKLNGERTSVKLGIPLPSSKWHPIVRPRLVSWSKPEPGIGLLKVTGFPGQVGIDVAKEIDHAISELSDCDRLIIDLRGNPRGWRRRVAADELHDAG